MFPHRKAGAPALPVPPGIDFTLPLHVIAEEHGVSFSTARNWRLRAGVPSKGRGRPTGHHHPVYELLTQADWDLGASHVSRLAGVTRQAAYHAGVVRGKYHPK